MRHAFLLTQAREWNPELCLVKVYGRMVYMKSVELYKTQFYQAVLGECSCSKNVQVIDWTIQNDRCARKRMEWVETKLLRFHKNIITRSTCPISIHVLSLPLDLEAK